MSEKVANELEFFSKRAYLSQEIVFSWPFISSDEGVRPLKEGEESTLKVVTARVPLQQMSDAGLRASIKAPVGTDAYNNYFMFYLAEHLGNAIKDEAIRGAFSQMNHNERALVLASYLAEVREDQERAEKNAST